ncbi:MAG: TolC family protein [Janthinobacterium lividum]
MRKNALLLTFIAAGVCVGTWPAEAQTAAPTTDSQPLTLAQITTLAVQSSPALAAARQNLAQAQARVGQAQAQRRFQVTFNSTVSESNASVYQPPPSQETFGTLQNTLTVPLPLGRRPKLAETQAQEQRGAVSAQFDSARLALAGQVAVAYYDLLRKQALLAVAQETLSEDTRALSDVQKRSQAGDAAQLDVLQAQVPVASAQAALDGAQNDLDVARESLNSLVGRPLDSPLAISDVTPNSIALPYTLDQAQAFALSRSPDMRAAEATIRANEAALSVARLYRDPIVSLQAIDIRSKDVTSFRSEDTIQAAVTLPLADGGLGNAQIQEAQAALEGARAQVEAIRRQTIAAISAAYLTAESRRRQVEAARTAQTIAQITYDKTTLGYRNGLFPLLQVLNARAALTQARIAYTQATYDAAAASGTLFTTFGGATPAPAGTVPLTPTVPATGANGTSPAGAGGPGTSPSGNSTTGTGTGGAGGRGTP